MSALQMTKPQRNTK